MKNSENLQNYREYFDYRMSRGNSKSTHNYDMNYDSFESKQSSIINKKKYSEDDEIQLKSNKSSITFHEITN